MSEITVRTCSRSRRNAETNMMTNRLASSLKNDYHVAIAS